ncbi:lactate utilization protein [Dysosmobacter sp.]|uniref:lactate utilization protein n=1 Tax=Dysosmobacter sp. TaxID=2591382 RepID=UPI002A8683EE|nr:lactate utilization protein [Dysosmobacter sp.]MDY3282793.1 lactate utilization protein [Dysosmobacter sp.]
MADLKKAQEALQQHGFEVRVFQTGQEAVNYLNEAIDGVSVGIGGSATVQELKLYDVLSTHNEVHWHWVNGPQERAVAATADVYLVSANALAETGEIVNIDGAGNRVASTLYGHKKVYFIIGRNKLTPDFHQAIWRARNVAAPKNAVRLKRKTPCAVKGDRCYDCKSPERLCRGLVVLMAPMQGMAAEVILIDEDLGF